MAKYFLHIKVFSRGKGNRVTRAAAYRAGERIRDERTSEVYNYSDRQDVLHKEVVLASQFVRGSLSPAPHRSSCGGIVMHPGRVVPAERFELPTNGLQNRCSTTELSRRGKRPAG